eukprot:COSAG02_NODE_11651_length_1681_cov_1.311631_2_plen_371_part_00
MLCLVLARLLCAAASSRAASLALASSSTAEALHARGLSLAADFEQHDGDDDISWSSQSHPPSADELGPGLDLRLFSEEQAEAFGARCLDGSPSGYYYRAGSQQDSFVIMLAGGGLCTSAADCKKRSTGPLGTSTKWASNITGSNVFGTVDNPFGDWNHVFVPYGSGDTYIGTQRESNSIGLFFAGHNTLEAVVSDLQNRSRFNAARRVLLSGRSAGGIGVFQNADWLGEQLDLSRVTYKATPQCGAFFTNSMLKLMPQYTSGVMNGSSGGGGNGVDAAAVMSDYLVSFYGGTEGPGAVNLDRSCTAAKAPLTKHTCWSAAVHYPHISTPLLIAQNRYDAFQCGNIMGVSWWSLPNGTKQENEEAKTAYIR